ncbi:hypothetical protein K491DRAFT_477184 [Lophiostoma macrostomum CBS 122681]|uniref:Peptidase S28 n=1 Tax=Lophiostoma macrostomum CBS 122681 TaxID=1314788 RepID=A0A6A6TNR7_9PLEO|nr:hypothetical protein K491DRAFT_477184 [Lophiostoma macrostomum CBS 122681]
MSFLSPARTAVWWSFLSSVLSQTISGPFSDPLIKSDYPFYNITQPLYHDGSGTGSFNQRFQLVTDFYKPGGPILFTIGPEDHIPAVDNSHFYDMAKELGGAAAVLEHRFFGTSLPDGFDGSVQWYAPLTLDNVMKDATTFIKYAKSNMSCGADSKVFIWGGSYGANLAISMRVKHPEVFDGAFASGAATESFGPSPDGKAKFGTAMQLSNIYYDESIEAASKVQAAMLQFASCVAGQNCSEALPGLNFCGTTPNATEFAKLYAVASANYRFIPEFNYPIAAAYSWSYPFQHLINATLNATSAGESIRIPLAMVNAQKDLSQCVNWNSTNIMSGSGINVPVSESWDYLTCQYFPTQNIAFPSGSILPTYAATGPIPTCPQKRFESAIYNQSNEKWQEYLSTDTPTLDKTTRLVIFQSGYDRVAGIGMPRLTLSEGREHSRVIFTAGLAHTSDSLPERTVPRGVQQELDIVRDTQLEILKSWLHTVNATTAFDAPTHSELERRRGGDANDDNDDDDDDGNHKSRKTAIIVGSVVGGIFTVGAISFWVWFCCCLSRRHKAHQQLQNTPSRSGPSLVMQGRGWPKGEENGAGEELLRDPEYPRYEAYRGQA